MNNRGETYIYRLVNPKDLENKTLKERIDLYRHSIRVKDSEELIARSKSEKLKRQYQEFFLLTKNDLGGTEDGEEILPNLDRLKELSDFNRQEKANSEYNPHEHTKEENSAHLNDLLDNYDFFESPHLPSVNDTGKSLLAFSSLSSQLYSSQDVYAKIFQSSQNKNNALTAQQDDLVDIQNILPLSDEDQTSTILRNILPLSDKRRNKRNAVDSVPNHALGVRQVKQHRVINLNDIIDIESIEKAIGRKLTIEELQYYDTSLDELSKKLSYLVDFTWLKREAARDTIRFIIGNQKLQTTTLATTTTQEPITSTAKPILITSQNNASSITCVLLDNDFNIDSIHTIDDIKSTICRDLTEQEKKLYNDLFVNFANKSHYNHDRSWAEEQAAQETMRFILANHTTTIATQEPTTTSLSTTTTTTQEPTTTSSTIAQSTIITQNRNNPNKAACAFLPHNFDINTIQSINDVEKALCRNLTEDEKKMHNVFSNNIVDTRHHTIKGFSKMMGARSLMNYIINKEKLSNERLTLATAIATTQEPTTKLQNNNPEPACAFSPHNFDINTIKNLKDVEEILCRKITKKEQTLYKLFFKKSVMIDHVKHVAEREASQLLMRKIIERMISNKRPVATTVTSTSTITSTTTTRTSTTAQNDNSSEYQDEIVPMKNSNNNSLTDNDNEKTEILPDSTGYFDVENIHSVEDIEKTIGRKLNELEKEEYDENYRKLEKESSDLNKDITSPAVKKAIKRNIQEQAAKMTMKIITHIEKRALFNDIKYVYNNRRNADYSDNEITDVTLQRVIGGTVVTVGAIIIGGTMIGIAGSIKIGAMGTSLTNAFLGAVLGGLPITAPTNIGGKTYRRMNSKEVFNTARKSLEDRVTSNEDQLEKLNSFKPSRGGTEPYDNAFSNMESLEQGSYDSIVGIGPQTKSYIKQTFRQIADTIAENTGQTLQVPEQFTTKEDVLNFASQCRQKMSTENIKARIKSITESIQRDKANLELLPSTSRVGRRSVSRSFSSLY